MIDLHLHTTASDGRLSPERLVEEAAAAGVRTMAVTDHDTLAGVSAARAACEAAHVAFIVGIEITAVHQGIDVHVLGYFLDEEDATLQAFLATQRQDRRRRLAEMADRLALAGAPVAIDALLAQPASSGRAVGRPQLAAALIEAGHARDVADAFDRFLAPGRPGFASRRGAGPAEVVQLIAAAGGLASLAHPIKLPDQSLVGEMIAAGLPAIEVFHPDHDDDARGRYAALASEHRLLVTGGSDFHGSAAGRENHLGRVGLPDGELARLIAAKPARESR